MLSFKLSVDTGNKGVKEVARVKEHCAVARKPFNIFALGHFIANLILLIFCSYSIFDSLVFLLVLGPCVENENGGLDAWCEMISVTQDFFAADAT